MSVMLLGLDLYQEVYIKACSYQYRPVVDIDYCQSLSKYEGPLREWIATLYEMNEISFSLRYGKEIERERIAMCKEIINGWRPNDIRRPKCSTYQMLKHLECIQYQIEMITIREHSISTEKHEQAWKLLADAIHEIMGRIVHSQREYETAKWSSV